MFIINMLLVEENFQYTRITNTKEQALVVVQNEISEYLFGGPGFTLTAKQLCRLEMAWNNVDSLIEEWNKLFSLEFELCEQEPETQLKQLNFNEVFYRDEDDLVVKDE